MSKKLIGSLDSFITTSNTTTNKYHQIRYYVEPVILFSGIIFNLVLILIIYTKKRTKSLRSTKPLRYLLICMLISDTWYLVYHVNVWYFFVRNRPDLSSFNILCQLNTYFNYFFSILLEFNMLSADWILLRIVFKSSKSAAKTRDRGVSIYDQFNVKADKPQRRTTFPRLRLNSFAPVNARRDKCNSQNQEFDVTETELTDTGKHPSCSYSS